MTSLSSHPRVQALRTIAAAAGLDVTQFNSGSRHEANGFRFYLYGGPLDHFGEGRLFHAATIEEAEAFMAGWQARRDRA